MEKEPLFLSDHDDGGKGDMEKQLLNTMKIEMEEENRNIKEEEDDGEN